MGELWFYFGEMTKINENKDREKLGVYKESDSNFILMLVVCFWFSRQGLLQPNQTQTRFAAKLALNPALPASALSVGHPYLGFWMSS